jgi:hypothetical protein
MVNDETVQNVRNDEDDPVAICVGSHVAVQVKSNIPAEKIRHFDWRPVSLPDL